MRQSASTTALGRLPCINAVHLENLERDGYNLEGKEDAACRPPIPPLAWLKKERKKTDNPREGWEDGTGPPPHRDFRRASDSFQPLLSASLRSLLSRAALLQTLPSDTRNVENARCAPQGASDPKGRVWPRPVSLRRSKGRAGPRNGQLVSSGRQVVQRRAATPHRGHTASPTPN